MKKILFSLLGALFTFGVAQAQTLSIDDVEVKPGETTSFELKIDVAGGQYSGFQFQMQFPATGFTLTGTTISSDWESSTFSTGDLNSEGKANASAYSSADKAIPDGEQVIGSVKFTAASNLALGDYEVTISGFDYLDGTNYIHANNGADLTFTIHVVNMHTVYLDEESTKAPVASGEDVIVNMKRTINANTWSTICLPFAISESQMAAVFGEGVKLADFGGSDSEYDGDDNVTRILMNFNTVNAIEKNHPYIINVSEDISELTVNGVNLEPDEDGACIEYDNGRTGARRVVYSGFYGTYRAETPIDAYCLFLSDNKFWYSSSATAKMKAYRAYFSVLDILTEVEEAGVKIALNIDGSTTSINAINNDGIQTGETYDLSGRKVSKPQQRGIYIIDGKKVAVK